MDTSMNLEKKVIKAIIIIIVIINCFLGCAIVLAVIMEIKGMEKENYSSVEVYEDPNKPTSTDSKITSNHAVAENWSEEEMATLLFDIYPIQGDISDFLSLCRSNHVDIEGNRYPYMVWCSNYLKEAPVEVTYALGGNYTRLEFTMGLLQGDYDTSDHGWLEFYDGDTLIYETTHFTNGVSKEDFCVDVTDVDELKIVIGSDSDGYALNAGVFLLISEFVLF